jgi:2-polyprenyl-3-methyl-5-hydroxy-6-metoxy-1,4-benzoquinol methylase
MITLRDENCPICMSSNRRSIGKPGRIGDAFKGLNDIDKVVIVQCLDCTAKYIHPMIYFSEDFAKKLYSLDYFSRNGTLQAAKNVGEKIRIMADVQNLSGDPHGQTLLDIGCGTGEFLKAAADIGFTVTGIDVDSTTTAYVTNKYGFRTVTGLLGPGTFPPNTFDVVVLSHVIEHLQRPAEILEVIRGILKPDGLFVMCTPNSDSLLDQVQDAYGRYRYDRGKSYYLTPFLTPYHIIGLNLKSVQKILERTGFAVEYCKLFSGLEWEDKNRKLIMRSLKAMGALLGKGLNIVTISRRPRISSTSETSQAQLGL